MATQQLHPTVLALLEPHGVRPLPTTAPSFVREYVNRLYVLQIIDLRLQRKELESVFGPQPLEPYRAAVEALRGRYEILSLPLEEWRAEP